MPLTPPVVADHLTVSVDGATILRDVTFTASAGETLAILGANGSGKSTLVKTLVGLHAPTAGTVRVLGGEPARGDVPWDRVGYVPQRVGAASGVPATALEVVTSGVLHRGRLRASRAGRRAAREALDLVGLAHRAADPVSILSGGQQRRVLIARALARQPELLVLDEPLAGVDRVSREALVEALRRLHAQGRTILVVLHETAELAGLVQRCVVLHQGAVVHEGAPPPAAVGHDAPGHDHVHPHEDTEEPALYRIPPLSQDPR